MAQISAAMVKELREATGSGIMVLFTLISIPGQNLVCL
jgi:hypothetical protein